MEIKEKPLVINVYTNTITKMRNIYHCRPKCSVFIKLLNFITL